MNLEDYLAIGGSKYAVIRYDSYLEDSLAQSISVAPRVFNYQGVEMVVLSLDPSSIPSLVSYVNINRQGVEYSLTLGTGKVTLLTHSQILEILQQTEEQQ